MEVIKILRITKDKFKEEIKESNNICVNKEPLQDLKGQHI